jgi:ABC-2 type transport system ATP-binding protein
MDDPVLAISGLTKRYGATPVLRGVDMILPRGSVMGLLGTNGAGKSTLLRCALGLAHADGGHATIFGTDARVLDGDAKQRIGYVAQEPATQRWMTVDHLIGYVGAFYPRWDQALVDGLAASWSIPRGRRIDRLSPGESQRLSILLALGHRPDLLLLDEPAASLDPMARRSFLAEILAIAAEGDRTVLLSTHLTSDLERAADTVAILKDGRIAFCGSLDELKDSIKRVRISGRDLPERFDQPWVLASQRLADGALLTVRGDVAAAIDALGALRGSATVEDLNLEDIFLELHR